jgi:hypothetical protein
VSDREGALRKVQGLLAKADSTEFDAEAEALIAKALDLMARHSIDEAEARERRGQRAEPPVAVEWEYSPSDSNASGKGVLLDVVCRAAGVQFVDFPNRRGANTHRTRPDGTRPGVASQWCYLAGFPADVERAQVTYTTLLLQAIRYGRADFAACGGGDGQSKFLTAYLMGFAIRVDQRYRALRETSPKRAGGAEIVLRRDGAIRDLLDGMGLNLRDVNPKGGNDRLGRRLGFEAGGRADLGQTRVDPNRTKGVGRG